MHDLLRNTLLCLLLSLSITASAQQRYTIDSKKAIKKYNLAISEYSNRNIKEALLYIDEALAAEPEFVEAYLLQADIYNYIELYDKELVAYSNVEVINPNYYPYMYYNYGLSNWHNGNYLEAKRCIEIFVQKEGIKEQSLQKAHSLNKKCDFAIELISNPVVFNPVNMGDSINNSADQYWPSLSLDGNTIIYTVMDIDTTRRTVYGDYAYTEDFFVSYKHDNYWSKGERIQPPLNTPENEGAQKLSADGDIIVFTGCNRNDGYGMCDIYFSFKTAYGWSRAVSAGGLINTRYSEKQPVLSPDNRQLYFSSNRPGGNGKMDLYVSELGANGEWQKPVNMGSVINTHKDDIAPFVYVDNATLYFSSNGHLGLGMQDIFMSKKNDKGLWGEPVNIGYPINTYQDEFGLIVDNSGQQAYYSSNAQSASTNIYTFELPEKIRPLPVTYLHGKIYDSISKAPLQASFQLIDIDSGDTIMESFAKKDGQFVICIPVGKRYVFNASADHYLFYTKHIELPVANENLPQEINIAMNKVEAGERIILDNIFFASDSYELARESNIEIAKLRELIIHNSTLKFEIAGFTDNSSSESYNMQLSLMRAKAVFDALDLPSDYIDNVRYKGYGQNNPIDTNDTDSGRANNRRTELKVIE